MLIFIMNNEVRTVTWHGLYEGYTNINIQMNTVLRC